jgi:hypothetical protein
MAFTISQFMCRCSFASRAFFVTSITLGTATELYGADIADTQAGRRIGMNGVELA